VVAGDYDLGLERGAAVAVNVASSERLLRASRAYRLTDHRGRGGGDYQSGWCWGYERAMERLFGMGMQLIEEQLIGVAL
jgi:hypothetical protein